MRQLLLIDDDAAIREITSRYLKRAGFEVVGAADAAEAALQLRTGFFDLAVVDIMLPDGSGLDIARKAISDYGLPVIMMTALGGIDEKSAAFRLGSDDYIVKPFDPNELVLRVEAVLKRVAESADLKDPVLRKPALSFGRPGTPLLEIDTAEQSVRLDGNPVPLPRREFQLLSLLATNANHTINREQIVDHLWGLDFEGELRVVDLYIDRLRKRLKLPEDQTPDWRIRTTRGVGYRLEVDA